MITWEQLLELGFTPAAVRHRVATGRLLRIYRGVYAVGRRELDDKGRWAAAVLACGQGAALSHESGGALWDLCRSTRLEVSVQTEGTRAPKGVTVHRRATLKATRRHNIPVTTPVFTLIDLAGRFDRKRLEAAINAADKRGLVDPEQLLEALDEHPGQRGIGTLRELLDRHTFVLTDSELERLFVPIAASAGLRRLRRRSGSMASGWISSGLTSDWWSRPTACATTGPPRSKHEITSGIRSTRRPGSRRSASPTPK